MTKNRYLKESYYCKQSDLVKLEDIRTYSPLSRIFRGLNNYSMRLGILNWLSCTLGAGILFIPRLISDFGLVLGILFLLINAIFSKYSFDLYLKFQRESKQKDMVGITEAYLGLKWAKLTKYSLIILIIVVKIVYIITAWKFFEHFLFYMNIINFEKDKNDFDPNSTNNFICRAVYTIIAGIILFPLVIKKNLNGFKYFTLLFLGLLFYTIIVFICQAYSFNTNYREKNTYHISWFRQPTLSWLSSYDSMVISFFCQTNCFKIWDEVLNPNKRRCSKIINISIIIELVIYLLVGIIGYWALGDNNMVDIISLRKPFFDNDFVMLVGVLLYGIGMIIGTSFFGPVLSQEIRTIFTMEPTTKNMIITGFLPTVFCLIFSLFLPSVMQWVSILGGIFCNFLGYFIPILIEIKEEYAKKRMNDFKMFVNILLQLFLILLAIGSFF